MDRRVRLLIVCLGTVSLGFAQDEREPAQGRVQVRLVEVLDGDTIRVWMGQRQEAVRYESIEATELDQAGGNAAREVHERLLGRQDLWLECARGEDGNLVHDGRKRLLGYVFLTAAGGECVNATLVREGAALISPRNIADDTPPAAFPLKYLDQLLEAQLDAARNRRGWWRAGDPHAAANFLVCFVKFWGKDEVVWLLNRGERPVDLAQGWTLADATGRRPFAPGQAIPIAPCELPPGGICRVHSGPGAEKAEVECGGRELDLVWRRQRVWNNDTDQAILRSPEGETVYVYTYNARGG